MTPHQTLAIAVRLFAIWLFIYSFTSWLTDYFGRYDTMVSSIALGVILIVCGVFWFFPMMLAKKILPKAYAVENNKNNIFEDWFSVGCSLIGVFALSKALPALVSYIGINYIARRLYPESYVQNPEWKSILFLSIFQLLFGLWLFFGGKGLKKILLWARYA